MNDPVIGDLAIIMVLTCLCCSSELLDWAGEGCGGG